MIPTSGFVDFHSHILPKVDHGSDSLETSLHQLALAKKNGVKRVVATSHFYPSAHSVDGFVKKRNEAYLLLSEHLNDMPEVRLGAEVLICAGIDHLPGIEKLFINGTNTLLLELPFSGYSNECTMAVKKMVMDGVDVVLAHADRYSPRIIEELLPFGVKIQLNASSLVGFGKLKNKHLFKWFAQNKVVALGSDIHGKDSSAYRKLVKAYSNIGSYAEFVSRESDARWNASKPGF